MNKKLILAFIFALPAAIVCWYVLPNAMLIAFASEASLRMDRFIPLLCLGVVCAVLFAFFLATANNEHKASNDTKHLLHKKELPPDALVIGTPGSGKARSFIVPNSELINLIPREIFDSLSEEEQKEYLESVLNALRHFPIHASGTGMTRGLIGPLISAEISRQTTINDTCERIAKNLSETIETEW